MAKVFVSLPMNGRKHDEIVEEQKALVKEVSAKIGIDLEMIDSCISENVENLKPLECLGKSLEILAKADCVIFGKGWENARGCRIERLCAEQYGISILEVDVLEDKEVEVSD